MDFLSRGYSALRGEAGQQQSPLETIAKLCDRMEHSTLLEDRRAAVLGLKGMSRDYKEEVGSKSLDGLIKALKQDRLDIDTCKAILETLNVLCMVDEGVKPTPGSNLGSRFTEEFIKEPKNISIVLEILEEYDFYVRFHAIQLLATLLTNSPKKLQDAVLTAPMGMSRLMDMLDDKREVIRNEGLLLIISLTENNPEIQKIVAFENAFERLLDIILQEDGINGGIIVQDCLQLTHNLLRYNVSNQNYFRETSCIQRIPALLGYLPPEDSKSDPYFFAFQDWSEQKIVNALFMLELVRILVVPGNLNTKSNQNVMTASGLLTPCIELALSSNSPIRVKTTALYAVADIIRGNTNNQILFAQATVHTVVELVSTRPKSHARSESLISMSTPVDPNNYERLPPRPAVSAIVSTLTGSEDAASFSFRAAAAYCFQCYLFQNQDAQQAFATDLVAAAEVSDSEGKPNLKTAAELLLDALLDFEKEENTSDPYRAWFACISLSHVLQNNEEIKSLIRGVTFGDVGRGEEPISLVQSLTGNLMLAFQHAADVRIMLAYLSLFCVWFFESPKTVKDFLSEGANLQLLIAPISQSSGVDVTVQGLCAFLLGICYEYDREPDAPITRSTLQPLLLNRVGIDHFNDRIARLRESSYFKAATPDLHINAIEDTITLPDIYFDYTFTEFLKANHASIQKSVTRSPNESQQSTSMAISAGMNQNTNSTAGGFTSDEAAQIVNDLRTQVIERDSKIAEFEATIRSIEMEFSDERDALAKQIGQLEISLKIAQDALKEKQENLANVEKEQEDLLIYIEDITQKRKQDKSRLRNLGEDVSDDEEEDEGP